MTRGPESSHHASICCEAVYQKVGLSRRIVVCLVNGLKEITDCLEKGERRKCSSCGSFMVRKRPAHRPPAKTGTDRCRSRARVMVFKPSAI